MLMMFSDFWQQFINLMKTFKLSDALDIMIITFLIYKFVQIVRETRAWQIVKGILFLLGIFVIAKYFQFNMLSGLLSNVFQMGILAVMIIFQPEIRYSVERLGRSNIPRRFSKNVPNLDIDSIELCVYEVVDAAMDFQSMKTGALIVFERETKLGDVISTGTMLDATPSSRLIENIFFNKSPLHDGAMIIRDGGVYAAGCILPLTKEPINQDLGTRHRAAVGITEVSDAVVLVVSEETGAISIAINGVLYRGYDEDELKKKLLELLMPGQGSDNSLLKSIKSVLSRRSGNEKD